jgi:alpha-ketoglutarate-dependent 2,4-dichlorophenoxyacetate dioxygenase
VRDAADLKTVNLQANFQWHIDSTFLPVPALVNILTAKIVPSSGGATEFASTRAAWAAMPEALKARVGAAACGTTPASRANDQRGAVEMADVPQMAAAALEIGLDQPRERARGALYREPCVQIDGYDEEESVALLDELVAFCTQPEFVYSHNWSVGDVMLWDQRAVMHRGTPWPYEEPRKLDSTCSSVRDSDGLADMRIEPVEG